MAATTAWRALDAATEAQNYEMAAALKGSVERYEALAQRNARKP
ncbi:MAG: hypothetical protein ABSH50_22440 [Bryobacteraceae bacterium]|jgi:hypothetical protein